MSFTAGLVVGLIVGGAVGELLGIALLVALGELQTAQERAHHAGGTHA